MLGKMRFGRVLGSTKSPVEVLDTLATDRLCPCSMGGMSTGTVVGAGLFAEPDPQLCERSDGWTVGASLQAPTSASSSGIKGWWRCRLGLVQGLGWSDGSQTLNTTLK